MKIKTTADYMTSLQKLNPVIYYRGERIKDVTRHPATAPHVRSAAMTFSLANNEKYRDLATATSHLTPAGTYLYRCKRRGHHMSGTLIID